MQKITTKEEYHRRINVLIEYINNHLSENIDLNRLAELSGFSRWHFHRVVSAFLGEPIGSFIMRMRVETAARLLRYTDLPIQEISWRIGYDAPSSLSKLFKQFYGISPNEYRINKEYIIMKPEMIMPDLDIKGEVKEVPALQVIYIRLTGDYKQNDYCGTWGKLFGYVQQQGLPMGDCCPLCIYHDDPKVTAPEKLRTDVCMVLPVAGVAKGEVGAKVIPAGRCAVFLYKGSYADLQAVYDTIYAKLIPEMGCTLRDEPSYERYLNDPRDTAPEELLTEISIAVE